MPTRLVISILEAKNQKEAQRIIAAIGRAKGGGKPRSRSSSSSSSSSDDAKTELTMPSEPCVKTGNNDGDDADDGEYVTLPHLNMYVRHAVLFRHMTHSTLYSAIIVQFKN